MPFAEYTDFADCVSKNKDKEDPEAYCASVHKKATGKWPTEEESGPGGHERDGSGKPDHGQGKGPGGGKEDCKKTEDGKIIVAENAPIKLSAKIEISE